MVGSPYPVGDAQAVSASGPVESAAAGSVKARASLPARARTIARRWAVRLDATSVTVLWGMTVRARVRTAPAHPAGTWTSWAIALPDTDWEEHDEQVVWEEIDC